MQIAATWPVQVEADEAKTAVNVLLFRCDVLIGIHNSVRVTKTLSKKVTE